MKKIKQNFTYSVFCLCMLFSGYTFSQQISGTIQDEESNPIPGVTIVVEGSDSGTTSDFDGNFSIDANTGDILTFSFIGFETITVPATGDQMSIIMNTEDTLLDEVVITGLGTSVRRPCFLYQKQQP